MNYIFIVSTIEKCSFSINKLLLPTTNGVVEKKKSYIFVPVYCTAIIEKFKIEKKNHALWCSVALGID